MSNERLEIEFLIKQIKGLGDRIANVVDKVVGVESSEDVLEANFYPSLLTLEEHLKAIYFIAFDEEMSEL